MSADQRADGGNTPCACGSTNGVHPRGTWGCAYKPAGGNTSSIDWSRATVVVKVPVVHTASETWQEIEVPLAYLVPDEGYRKAVLVRLESAHPGRGQSDG